MTTLLVIYLLGLTPMWFVYARWLYRVQERIMDPYPAEDYFSCILLGTLCMFMWPVGWIAVVVATAVVLGPPEWMNRSCRWLLRQVFRGM